MELYVTCLHQTVSETEHRGRCFCSRIWVSQSLLEPWIFFPLTVDIKQQLKLTDDVTRLSAVVERDSWHSCWKCCTFNDQKHCSKIVWYKPIFSFKIQRRAKLWDSPKWWTRTREEEEHLVRPRRVLEKYYGFLKPANNFELSIKMSKYCFKFNNSFLIKMQHKLFPCWTIFLWLQDTKNEQNSQDCIRQVMRLCIC